MSYDILTEKFKTWAETCPDIRTAIITGSQARQDHSADEWSDMDIIIYADDSPRYLAHTDWVNAFGPTWLTLTNTVGGREPLLRCLFQGGYTIDFFIYPREMMGRFIKDGVYPRCFHQGARLIVDKDNLGARIIPPSFSPLPLRPPTEDEFLEIVHSFSYLAVHSAKKLLRGELWLVHVWDGKIKEHLLTMLQWQARAKKGWDYDTWYAGHFLEEWADAGVVERLSDAFARYDDNECREALLVTMDLFRGQAKEVAGLLGYTYPESTDESVSGWIKKQLTDQ